LRVRKFIAATLALFTLCVFSAIIANPHLLVCFLNLFSMG